ncbi:hypothetical protein F5B21DRAFT_480354 [Xylaria acuta]|nr:hypothetical protein F5B21DRAFT_480354 [Xylaria acuta]
MYTWVAAFLIVYEPGRQEPVTYYTYLDYKTLYTTPLLGLLTMTCSLSNTSRLAKASCFVTMRLLSGSPCSAFFFFIGRYLALDNKQSPIRVPYGLIPGQIQDYVRITTQRCFCGTCHCRNQVPKQVPEILRRHSPLSLAFLSSGGHHVVFDKTAACCRWESRIETPK